MLVKKMVDLIGNTPLLEAKRYGDKFNLKGNLYAKLEYLNPAGSIKDRAARGMIYSLYKQGKIQKDTVLIEPTSGNTGIALAAICASLGIKMIVVMPESMSIERRKLMLAYKAELVLTPRNLGMNGALMKAEELKNTLPNSFIIGQFENPENAKAHYETTGPEIYKDLDSKVDVLVSGVGTGGTITGIGSFLKQQNKNIEIVAVEPSDSPLLTTGKAGPHKIQGIGANFIPSLLDQSVIDKIMTVSTKEAYDEVHNFALTEGIFVGISSGAALSAAKKLALMDCYKDKNIVVILPDGGSRYLSTDLIEGA